MAEIEIPILLLESPHPSEEQFKFWIDWNGLAPQRWEIMRTAFAYEARELCGSDYQKWAALYTSSLNGEQIKRGGWEMTIRHRVRGIGYVHNTDVGEGEVVIRDEQVNAVWSTSREKSFASLYNLTRFIQDSTYQKPIYDPEINPQNLDSMVTFFQGREQNEPQINLVDKILQTSFEHLNSYEVKQALGLYGKMLDAKVRHTERAIALRNTIISFVKTVVSDALDQKITEEDLQAIKGYTVNERQSYLRNITNILMAPDESSLLAQIEYYSRRGN